MDKYGFTEIQELVFNAESNADIAWTLLEKISELLNNNEPLGDDLRYFLADAFSAAAKEDTPQKRAATLAKSLYITASNRRPISQPDSVDIAIRVEKYLADDKSLNQAATNVAMDVKQEKGILYSESTIKREYKKMEELHQRMKQRIDHAQQFEQQQKQLLSYLPTIQKRIDNAIHEKALPTDSKAPDLLNNSPQKAPSQWPYFHSEPKGVTNDHPTDKPPHYATGRR